MYKRNCAQRAYYPTAKIMIREAVESYISQEETTVENAKELFNTTKLLFTEEEQIEWNNAFNNAENKTESDL